MGYSTIMRQYNGLYGFGGFMGAGYGFGNALHQDGYTETMKQQAANMYEITSATKAYANKEHASASSFNQQCQAMQYLFNEGRTDAALNKYRELTHNMESDPNYQGYDKNVIRTKILERYADATGTTLMSDIRANCKSDFRAGFSSAVPLIGVAAQDNSKNDAIAETTGVSKSCGSFWKSVGGIATAAGISGGIGFGIDKFIVGARAVAEHADEAAEAVEAGARASRGKGWTGFAIGVGLSLGTYIIGKIFKNKK